MLGKIKGSNFEREVAKKLSLWWSKGTNPKVFYRSHSSGALATVSPEAESQYGDIAALDESGLIFTKKFVVECKFYRNIDYEPLICCKKFEKSQIGDWIKKVFDLGEKIKRIPLLICKSNFRKEVVFTNGEGYLLIHKLAYDLATSTFFLRYIENEEQKIIEVSSFLFSDLLNIDPDKFLSAIKLEN